ncbi:MAG TPA: hypothetical protein PLG57_07290 [Bacteroidia bacterium]|nr:hypothetical protein [Bacteroidia bacterium]HQF28926.1 hypothetical protein [Bacteroidia bacterium]
MKSQFIVALFLILAILTESVSRSIIVIDFELNRDYFAKELCVKKDIPDNCCKGSCALKKELKQEDEREKSPAAGFSVKSEIVYFIQDNFSFQFYPNASIVKNKIVVMKIEDGFADTLFRPPLG